VKYYSLGLRGNRRGTTLEFLLEYLATKKLVSDVKIGLLTVDQYNGILKCKTGIRLGTMRTWFTQQTSNSQLHQLQPSWLLNIYATSLNMVLEMAISYMKLHPSCIKFEVILMVWKGRPWPDIGLQCHRMDGYGTE
jgi:hypothetical protein